jgi:hypothetical protein
MIESSDRLAWTQYRDGGAGTGNGLQSFRDKQPDKRLAGVDGYFDKDYANVDDLMGVVNV